jgi:hypothetical protein
MLAVATSTEARDEGLEPPATQVWKLLLLPLS